jgi:aspartyl-tRNA(Asn)/glutamyl-tRNA(Gln) amidotransferase subunit A
MPDRRDALAGYADWLEYGHGERAGAWLSRLDVNRPELDAFRAVASPDAQPYAARAAHVSAPDVDSSLPAASMLADAGAAVARARSLRELRAFTWMADVPPSVHPGFLGGLPIAVKDLMKVAGAPFTGGSRAIDAVVSLDDAEVVARLKRQGAAVIGLTNLHELAYGITSDNPAFGRVVNPVARDRIPGGSSGGSAAAIAAGIVRAALGTDTAGSIRIPAACCGIAGFKPSYDALPRHGVLDLAPSLDHVGPMGRDVEDCAMLFAAMLGASDVPAWRRPDMRGLRVARLRGYFDAPLDPDVRAAVDAAVRELAGDGATLRDTQIAGIDLAPAIQFNTIAPEATAVHLERLAQHADVLGEDVRVRLEMGLFLPGAWYVKAQRLRTVLVGAIERAFEDADLLLCATLRAPAPRVGAATVDIEGRGYPLHTAMTQLTLPFNLSGLPAIAVPWTCSRDGVPISLQIVGRRGDDWRVLAAGQRLQALAPSLPDRA